MSDNNKTQKTTLIIVALSFVIGGFIILGTNFKAISNAIEQTGKSVVDTVTNREPIASFAIQVKISQNKDNGKSWDFFGNPPDTFGKIFLDNEFFDRIDKRQDTHNFTAYFKCKDLRNYSEMRICLEDVDIRKNDPMGCQTFAEIKHNETVRNINYTARLLLPSKKKKKREQQLTAPVIENTTPAKAKKKR